MRQRVLIGMGLAADPQLLIADEPTSALDVTVQRVILDHLESLTRELGTTLLFITHDLGLAAERAEQLVVMYKGQVVESGPSVEILQNPQHPYTQRLVAAAPSLASRRIQASGGIAAAESSMADDASHAAGDTIDLIATAEARAEALEAAGIQPRPRSWSRTSPRSSRSAASGEFTAVDDVSFQIPKGTTMALVGESGSGKSTVAKMLLKLEDATSGKIVVGGKDLATRERQGAVRPPQPHAAGLPGPVRLAEPAAQHRQHHRRAAAHAQGRHQGLASRAGATSCSTRCRCRARSSAATRTSSRAASASASRSRVRSR